MNKDIIPSRVLDAALHRRFVGSVLSLSSGHFVTGGLPVPSYTASIDAAVSLCAQVLPGCVWKMYSEEGYQSVEVGTSIGEVVMEYDGEDGPRHALLLLGCMLALHVSATNHSPIEKDGRELQEADRRARKEEPLFLMHPDARAELQRAMVNE